jgi:hypothetical protein
VWPSEWPPPSNLLLRGFDMNAKRVKTAQRALAGDAQIDRQDLCEVEFPACSVIALLDVLFYLGEAEQALVLDKAAAALEPGGVLLLREANAAAGLTFQVTKWSERLVAALRGSLAPRLHYRSATRWMAELAARGFAVEVIPMSERTPFANLLFVARKVASPSV